MAQLVSVLKFIFFFFFPGSMSSNSSRDPSPIPPNRYSENLSNSSPNLIMPSSHPPHQRSHPHQQSALPVMDMSAHRDSPGTVSSAYQHRITQPSAGKYMPTMYNSPVILPSLVAQNSGQSKSIVGGPQSASNPQLSTSGPFPSLQRSNITVAPSSHQSALEARPHPVNYSQEVVTQSVTSQNIPSQFNQSSQQHRLETSHLPANIHPQNLDRSNNQQKFNKGAEPAADLPAGINYASPYVQTSSSVVSSPPLQQQPLSRQGLGIPHQNTQGQNSKVPPVPRTNDQNHQINRLTSQSGPVYGMLPKQGLPPPPSWHASPQTSPVIQHTYQPGIPLQMGNLQTQPGTPPATGDVQKPIAGMGNPHLPVPAQFLAPPQPGAAQHDGSHHLGKHYPHPVSYVPEEAPFMDHGTVLSICQICVVEVIFLPLHIFQTTEWIVVTISMKVGIKISEIRLVLVGVRHVMCMRLEMSEGTK